MLIIVKRRCAACSRTRRQTMTVNKIIIAAAILLGASSAALAQSAWTTGTAESRSAAGYTSPYGGSFYAYAPGGLHSFGMVSHRERARSTIRR
jgi:hypothetical protein